MPLCIRLLLHKLTCTLAHTKTQNSARAHCEHREHRFSGGVQIGRIEFRADACAPHSLPNFITYKNALLLLCTDDRSQSLFRAHINIIINAAQSPQYTQTHFILMQQQQLFYISLRSRDADGDGPTTSARALYTAIFNRSVHI